MDVDERIASMLREIEDYGYYTCECGNHVEADGQCSCGIPNLLITAKIA